MQPKVFQLFAQVDNHLDRAQGGLGIGLALVEQLVSMHGGTVSVSSPGTGQGSVFTIRLPLATAPAPLPVPQSAEIQAPATQRLKVLVVDDSVEIAQTIGWMLEEIGHDYMLVDDGRNALRVAKEFGPDVVLLDIGLPGMDGYAVCRAFRQEERFKSIPIIAQTGWGRDRDKSLAAEAGFDCHLVKPVSLAALERQLLEIMPR
jgi:CheY-like chemotaxis protein